MTFSVISLFPEVIESAMNSSITGRAIRSGLISLDCIDLKEFSTNSYGSVDDYTYGGGAGMLMQCEPVYRAYMHLTQKGQADGSRVIYTTPQGRVFNQEIAKELACEKDLIIICGHYEGLDQRLIDEIVTDEISIGDYVLTGGELPALVIMDSVSRLIPGVLGNKNSPDEESFGSELLEYPQYTRPKEWHGRLVPDILLSGDHARVGRWRQKAAIERTRSRRPELYQKWLARRGIY